MSLKEKFIYENELGEQIEFSPLSDFFLLNISGVAGITNIISTDKIINGDGVIIKSTSLNSRNIVIQGKLKKVNREANRRKLIRVLNPRLKGKLIYFNGNSNDTKYIDCLVESSPDPAKDAVSTFQISLLCSNPYWQSYLKSAVKINTWIGGWKFKFKLPFKFKQKGEPKKNIYIEGDVETPVEVIFKGPALNPSIINHRNGEFIKINRELTSDDTLYITTGFGNKKIEIEREGKRRNAGSYMDFDSTFLELYPGDNLIEYTTDNNIDPQSVEIFYRNRFVGI